MTSKPRTLPNILVTGTPGVGKSTLCKKLSDKSKLKWLDVSNFAKENDCLGEYDEEYKCPVLDEDKLLDLLEEQMSTGGNIVDYHGCDFFPQRWFDYIVVLRTNNTELYDRLAKRGYSGKKLEDNIDCEIFQTILEEAQESYDSKIIQEMDNSTESEMENNLTQILLWIDNWKRKNVS